MSTPEPGMGNAPVRPSDRLMLVTNARVELNRTPGSNSYSGWLADLRHGITRTGEVHSIRSAGPYLAGLRSERARSGAVRAAAIRAKHKDAATTTQTPIGVAFARLARKEGTSGVERQVGTLPLLDLEAASAALDNLVGRCAREGIAVNFVGLARALVHWGTGATIQAQSVRNKIVLDFHAAAAPDVDPPLGVPAEPGTQR